MDQAVIHDFEPLTFAEHRHSGKMLDHGLDALAKVLNLCLQITHDMSYASVELTGAVCRQLVDGGFALHTKPFTSDEQGIQHRTTCGAQCIRDEVAHTRVSGREECL